MARKQTNHTPGPWTVCHRHVDCGPDDDEMSGLGLEVDGPPVPMRGDYAFAADARLIAAAPDMLAALRVAHSCMIDRAASESDYEDVQQVVDAIDKACKPSA